MPLDVTLVRDRIAWSSAAATAFRQEIQTLEDQLLAVGIDDATLDVKVRSNDGGEGDIHAVLKIGPDRLDANGQDPDLAYGITQVFEQLRSIASPERLFDDGRGPVAGTDAPWEDILATVVATASHLVTRAVELGDLPPGVVDPRDLADDALVDVLENGERTMRAVRSHIRRHLELRIDQWGVRKDDVELDALANPQSPRISAVEDELYEYDQPDETALRESDVLNGDASMDDDDRSPPRQDA
ncbi:MAG: hypothetical protein ABMB14_26765 [Myxococcota bacterium]